MHFFKIVCWAFIIIKRMYRQLPSRSKVKFFKDTHKKDVVVCQSQNIPGYEIDSTQARRAVVVITSNRNLSFHARKVKLWRIFGAKYSQNRHRKYLLPTSWSIILRFLVTFAQFDISMIFCRFGSKTGVQNGERRKEITRQQWPVWVRTPGLLYFLQVRLIVNLGVCLLMIHSFIQIILGTKRPQTILDP